MGEEDNKSPTSAVLCHDGEVFNATEIHSQQVLVIAINMLHQHVTPPHPSLDFPRKDSISVKSEIDNRS
ncbi:hypothetical protein L1887_29075 [Cichorium endivia]|nr:hypothetical protein L1887_29075 [Cichorium endivia]